MKTSLQRLWSLLLLVLLCLGLGQGVVAQVPERPLDSTVLDQAGVLSQDTIRQIDAENQAWSKTAEQVQVGVLILDSLDGQDLEGLANDTFRKWQIGFAGTDNGVLLLIAMEERVFRIETSDQAATILTDVEAKRILDSSRDYFRQGDVDQGVLYLVTAIGDSFYGTNRAKVPLSEEEETDSEGGFVELLMFIIVVIFIIASRSGRGRGGRGGGGDLLWMLLASSHSSGSSRSSRSSGSFGGGGWSGGGGGGGGASSGW